MKMKTILIWSGANMLAAPLIGVGLAKADVPSLAAIYVMLAIFLAPMTMLIWAQRAVLFRDDQ